MSNIDATRKNWILSDDDTHCIDNVQQLSKGQCLQNIYNKNHNINLWSPLILSKCDLDFDIYDNKIDKLISGNISCIIIKNLITDNQCIDILKNMESNFLFKNNYDCGFRHNEIGITIDNHIWKNNPNIFWNECIKVNNLFDRIFNNKIDNIINPFDIFISTIQKVAGHKYTVKKMHNNNISCPSGVFRIITQSSQEFPHHTDGFNYGNILNNMMNIDKNLFPEIMNSDINSVISIILVLQQTDNSRNEVDLFNCLVSDLEQFRDDIGMYSHWMGTKYTKIDALMTILKTKKYYSPILNTGDLYLFSASRIHRVHNFINRKDRIVLASFACIKNNDIIIYQ